MLLKQFNKKKDIHNTLFVSLLISYLLLCLTLGGFHEGIFSTNHCDHGLQSVSHNNHHNADSLLVGISDDVSRHDAETCQICQWLKTPSTVVQFLTLDTQFDLVCISSPRNSNPILPSLSIHKFTIRPPPVSSCFFA